MEQVNKSVLSFGSMTLLVGGLAMAGLLVWGWPQQIWQRRAEMLQQR